MTQQPDRVQSAKLASESDDSSNTAHSDMFNDSIMVQWHESHKFRDMPESVMRLHFNIRDGDGRAVQILGFNKLLE